MLVAVLRRSLVPAVLATVLLPATYVLLQQHERLSMDDLPAQIAEDMADRMKQGVPPQSLIGGVKIDPRGSLAPFAIVLDAKGAVEGASFTLGHDTPHMPAGMLQAAKKNGEDRVTWEPEPGVRLATAVVYATDQKQAAHYLIVGHSLREAEKRIALYGWLAFAAWIVSIVTMLAAAFGAERLRD
jgi:hypothetical protein